MAKAQVVVTAHAVVLCGGEVGQGADSRTVSMLRVNDLYGFAHAPATKMPYDEDDDGTDSVEPPLSTDEDTVG